MRRGRRCGWVSGKENPKLKSHFSRKKHARNGDAHQLRGRERGAQLYWPAGFSAGLAEGFLVSAIEALGFQKSGSALIQSSEA